MAFEEMFRPRNPPQQPMTKFIISIQDQASTVLEEKFRFIQDQASTALEQMFRSRNTPQRSLTKFIMSIQEIRLYGP